MQTNKHIFDKLKFSGLRATKQRLKIANILFEKNKTFHFSISQLANLINKRYGDTVALATVYNTVHAFKNHGFLKEIAINSEHSYFDTNTTNHHHFYDVDKDELSDIENNDVSPIKIKKTIPGKKIKSIEVLVKISSEN
tara:strand:+ start:3450 stop:3866 length:417 start_codon:yes stop_codon:yes gene_type:complete